MFIVVFPDKWYLRGRIATGDKQRASRYATEDDARKALAQARHYFKAKSVKGATIEKVTE